MALPNGSSEGLGRPNTRTTLGDASLEMGTQAIEQLSCGLFDEDSRQFFKQTNEQSSKTNLPQDFANSKNLLAQLGILGDNANAIPNYSNNAMQIADSVIDKASRSEE